MIILISENDWKYLMLWDPAEEVEQRAATDDKDLYSHWALTNMNIYIRCSNRMLIKQLKYNILYLITLDYLVVILITISYYLINSDFNKEKHVRLP
ncbi:hypothetical protein T12_6666 [Trichinella patagoniensis]|uniref:Uncharacterized protein n=1 Tax=Trichinella patagoniensis TaxID=990121 RepID=A0A0V0Z821_9BILA|nr:hypothetical protein T12_11375 [Trichinella patagoniensis]KRY07486.1 hypothetical protein T12_8511 [Trichinella patagoniensis]KRY07510.1 hypothetical protein T12_5374 [Trichinella patagoniensis]KRY08606.1 hypothetical protein T12_10384 [Trichinella patagoniensis]KRY10156.1 hypothetical protein T12_6666 [Trichinella patagoniensis]